MALVPLSQTRLICKYRMPAGTAANSTVSPPAVVTLSVPVAPMSRAFCVNGKAWRVLSDFAIAMADELERPAHSRQRFTVGY